MAHSKPPKKFVSVGLPTDDQFDFFKPRLPATAVKRRQATIKRRRKPEPEILRPVVEGEIIEPEQVAGAKHTHAFNLHLRAHGLMLKSIIAFASFGILGICVKAGVPILQVALGPVLMAPDTFFLTGVLGLIEIAFLCAVFWYAWRVVDLAHLAGIPFQTTAPVLSRLAVYIGAAAFLVFAVLCLFVTCADTLRLSKFVLNNAILHPNGYGEWRQEVRPEK